MYFQLKNQLLRKKNKIFQLQSQRLKKITKNKKFYKEITKYLNRWMKKKLLMPLCKMVINDLGIFFFFFNKKYYFMSFLFFYISLIYKNIMHIYKSYVYVY